ILRPARQQASRATGPRPSPEQRRHQRLEQLPAGLRTMQRPEGQHVAGGVPGRHQQHAAERAKSSRRADGRERCSMTRPPDYLPTPEEIAAACAEIQSTWSELEWITRRGYSLQLRQQFYHTPEMKRMPLIEREPRVYRVLGMKGRAA